MARFLLPYDPTRPPLFMVYLIAHHHNIVPRNSVNTATAIHPSITAPSIACVIPRAPLRLLLLVLARSSKLTPECPFEVARTVAATVGPTFLVVTVVANVVDGPLSTSERASLFKKMRVYEGAGTLTVQVFAPWLHWTVWMLSCPIGLPSDSKYPPNVYIVGHLYPHSRLNSQVSPVLPM